MTRKLSLDLGKVIQDTRTIATATAVANAEGQIAAPESRSDVLNAVWAAEGLLEALENLRDRSEAQWDADDRERRYQEMVARREARSSDDERVADGSGG